MIGNAFAALPLVPTQPTRVGWSWHRLTDIARLATGHTPSRRHAEYWDGDIPWLQLPDIRALDGQLATDTSEHINELGLANSAAVLLPAGTVCLSRTASVGFVTITGRPMATSQDFVNWVCGPDLDPQFLMYLLLANRASIRDLGSGAVHHTVYFPTVESFCVCVPEVAEQRRVATLLGHQLAHTDLAKRAALERASAAEGLASAYLREVFESPRAQAWVTVRLADLLRAPIRTGISRPTRPDSNKRCLTLSAVRGRTLLLDASKPVDVSDTEAQGNWIQPGCFYVVRGNGNRELVGRGAFAPETIREPILYPDLLFRVALGDAVDPIFFFCLWCSAPVRREIERRATTAAGIYKINTSNLNSLPLRLPPLVEQRSIVSDLLPRIDAAEALRRSCGAEVASLEAVPAALLRTGCAGRA